MSHVHEDREHEDPWILWPLTVASGLLAGTAGQILLGPFTSDGVPAFVAGAALGSVVVRWARFVSVRTAARTIVAVSALAQLRLGVLGDSLLSGSQGTLAWVVAAAVVLVLTDLVSTTARPPMRNWTPPAIRGVVSRRASATAVALVAFVLLVAPLVLPVVTNDAQSGQGPRLQSMASGGVSIRATDTLDMTTRPDLSDEVVFEVTANRGTFWRGQTYDRWDGRRWTQTEPARFPLMPDDEVFHASDDVGADGDDVVTQRYRMEATYSDVVFAAASAVRVESRRDLLQGADGTLVTAGTALGRDTTYTVVSRRPVLDEALLRSAPDDVPDDILDRYAARPEATDRVVEAALAATDGATTTYDRVRALERWMGDRTEYSLDAPLSPVGVDVVDHFLFDSRLGWCEQVASSLVVLARANGIPARLVTGFVPGEVDRLTGAYVVRARDAHAWTEVWFSGVGWVPFDPTASVPLAGADPADRSIGRWLLDHAVVLVVGAAASGLAVYGLSRLVRRMWDRRAARPVGWVAETDARLVELGEQVEWPRSKCETASRFADSLARHVRDPRLVEVGAAIDRGLYAPVGPDDATRARVDEILESVVDLRPVPEISPGADGGEGPRGGPAGGPAVVVGEGPRPPAS